MTVNEQFIRSFEYAGLATLFSLLIGYPLAYVIAFRAGRWRNALLLAVIVPFFVTYLIRTLSWETILSDSGVVVDTLKALGLVGSEGRILDTTADQFRGSPSFDADIPDHGIRIVSAGAGPE